MKDIDVINGFLKNDEKIIADFYKYTKLKFCLFFKFKYSKDDEYVKDLYQDACTIVWNNIQTGKLNVDNLTSSIYTYLISVGKYTLMSKDKKFKEIVKDDDIMKLEFVEDDAEELKAKVEREDFVNKMVDAMKPPCSDILKAFYWYKLSCVEIAEKHNFSNADSVKSQKYKCVQKLKSNLAIYKQL